MLCYNIARIIQVQPEILLFDNDYLWKLIGEF